MLIPESLNFKGAPILSPPPCRWGLCGEYALKLFTQSNKKQKVFVLNHICGNFLTLKNGLLSSHKVELHGEVEVSILMTKVNSPTALFKFRGRLKSKAFWCERI